MVREAAGSTGPGPAGSTPFSGRSRSADRGNGRPVRGNACPGIWANVETRGCGLVLTEGRAPPVGVTRMAADADAKAGDRPLARRLQRDERNKGDDRRNDQGGA